MVVLRYYFLTIRPSGIKKLLKCTEPKSLSATQFAIFSVTYFLFLAVLNVMWPYIIYWKYLSFTLSESHDTQISYWSLNSPYPEFHDHLSNPRQSHLSADSHYVAVDKYIFILSCIGLWSYAGGIWWYNSEDGHMVLDSRSGHVRTLWWHGVRYCGCVSGWQADRTCSTSMRVFSLLLILQELELSWGRVAGVVVAVPERLEVFVGSVEQK